MREEREGEIEQRRGREERVEEEESGRVEEKKWENENKTNRRSMDEGGALEVSDTYNKS